MPKRSEQYFLPLLLLGGLFFRAIAWIRSGGMLIREGNPDVDNYLNICSWIWSGNLSAILEYRPTQLFYPLLLTPVAIGNFPLSPYIFALHEILTALTLCFVFLTARRLFGSPLALIAGFFIVLNWRMATWFTWMFTEICYYFTVSWVVYTTTKVWEKRSFPRVLHYTIACLCAFFTKPESVALVATSFLTLLYFAFRKSRSPSASLLLVSGISIAGLVFILGLLFGVQKIQKAFLSHIHVAHGFWLSTHTGANAGGVEQDKAFQELGQIGGPGSGSRQSYYLRMSRAGLALIQNEPLHYLWLCFLRMTSLLFPALYFDFSPLTRILDGLLSIAVVLGAILALNAKEKREEVRALFSLGLGMTLFTSFYLADGDTRFRLPIYLVFSFIAAKGWDLIFQEVLSFRVWFLNKVKT